MRKLYYFLVLLLIFLTCFWLQAETDFLPYHNFFQLRSALIQITGLISVTLMSIAMLLAMRLRFIERQTHGLDKSFRLHKHLGIASVTMAIVHWLLAIIPKYLVQWQLLARPEKGNGPFNEQSLYSLIKPLRGIAESIGEYSFYGFVILVAISLLSAIKYKNFKITHRLISICFLAIAFHSAILIKHAYWPYPITYIALTFITLGSCAALWSLFGQIGKSKQHSATIVSATYNAINKVLDLTLQTPNWHGHKSGQFAFIQFPGEEAHPFTIASADHQQGKLSFLIKELGDFTSKLKEHVSVGQQVKVEGPYGCFNFAEAGPQLWIAGGIGIAAFKAILQERGKISSDQKVVLYYCTETPDNDFLHTLQAQATQANVTLKVINNRLDPFLTVTQLNKELGNITQYKIWFCGPTKFSHALKCDLKTLNYDLHHFHEELFEMR
ncbi:ferric reductase-like transmembrane domain-containing protein [Psychromonas sp. MME1]|uniref:ferredoxin reductase family protein n=1 Tax=Psychromonas sp. MME1 TaxID=3231032 RepID=UPI0034E290FA